MHSMLYTIGTALNRAADNGFAVSLLVEGHWMDGMIAANDGVGIVLECLDGGHMVAKIERISAVRIMADLPGKTPITMGSDFDHTGAMPMPGPQPAYA